MAETTLSSPALKALMLKLPVDAVTEPRLSAAYDVVVGLVEYLLEQNTSPGPKAAQHLARAKMLEQLAHGQHNASDSTELKLGRALGELFGPVAILKGITAESWASLMPREVAAMSTERSPTASAADDIFGSLSGFAEGVVNTFLPEGFESDIDDSGSAVDLFDAGQDALNIGGGDESATSTTNPAATLQAAGNIAGAAQTVLAFL